MRAWTYTTAKGGLENTMTLRDDVPEPALPKDGILVKVHYMSLNPVDYKLPELGLIARVMVGSPATPGLDFSGTVVKIGSGVTPAGLYHEGQQVSGRLSPAKNGSLGEYIIAKHDGLIPLPSSGVSLVDASCGGTAALSAYQAIAPYVKSGDRVFIQGGSGGVGTLGIQIAAALGCQVTVSSSARNVELCKSLGASDVVDYKKEDVEEYLKRQGKVFKVVVDAGPNPGSLYRSMDEWLVPGPDGRCVLVNVPPALAAKQGLAGLVGMSDKRLVCYGCFNNHDDLAKIIDLMREGKMKVVHEDFAFEDANKAIEKLRNGQPGGKIVVRVTA